MKFFRLLKRDLNLGIVKRLFMFLIPVIIAYMQVKSCSNVYDFYLDEGIVSTPATIIDYFMFCTQGMYIYHFAPSNYFIIPVYWFLFVICISYIIAYYTYDDYERNGRNLYLAVGNRRSWWNAKCVWCILSVALYFLIYIGSVVLFSVIRGSKLKLTCTKEFVESALNQRGNELSINELALVTIIIPFVIMVGMCMIQIILGFIITPVASFAVISGVYVLSAYYTIWWLPGSYTMWLRCSMVNAEGVRPISGLIYGLTLLFVAWYGGRNHFASADII